MNARRWIRVGIAAGIVAGIAVAGAWLHEAALRDACLDAGGAWQDGTCRR